MSPDEPVLAGLVRFSGERAVLFFNSCCQRFSTQIYAHRSQRELWPVSLRQFQPTLDSFQTTTKIVLRQLMLRINSLEVAHRVGEAGLT